MLPIDNLEHDFIGDVFARTDGWFA